MTVDPLWLLAGFEVGFLLGLIAIVIYAVWEQHHH